MDLFTTPDGKDPLRHRAELISKYGTRVLDMVRTRWRCAGCGAEVPADALILPAVEYRTLQDATEFFHRFVGELASAPAPMSSVPGQALAAQLGGLPGRPLACRACGGAPALEVADVHLYSSAHAKDLVLRLTTTAPPQVLVDDVPIGSTTALEASFARDAIVRALECAREARDVEAAARLMIDAAVRMPGDPEVMRFLPFLNDHDADDAVLAMADAISRALPACADGPFWRAQVMLQNANRRGGDPWLLDQARGLLDAALQLDPAHADAAVALANVHRIRRDDAEATRVLRALLQRDPKHAVANYTLGLVRLDGDPAEALACFERGERESPNDADFPRSRARALLALRRVSEARSAIARAIELAPDDSRVQQVAAQIERSNGRATTIKLVVWIVIGLALIGVIAIIASVLRGAS